MRMKGVTLHPFGLSDSEETVTLRVTDSSGQRMSGLGFVDRVRLRAPRRRGAAE